MKKNLGIIFAVFVSMMLFGCSSNDKTSIALESDSGTVTMYYSQKSDFVFKQDDSWGDITPHYIISSDDLNFKASMFIDADSWTKDYEDLKNRNSDKPKFKDGYSFNNYSAFTYGYDDSNDELFLTIFLGKVPADDVYLERIAYLRISLNSSKNNSNENLQELLKSGPLHDMLETISFSTK